METDPPRKQISTRQGLLLIALVIAGITAVSLARHWSQAATSDGFVVQTADGQKAVAIFTTDSCTYCAAAKQFLAQKKVPYTEFNLDRSEKARQVFGMLNGRGVPLIIVGESRLVGFDAGVLGRVLVEEGILQPIAK
jgi:glutaredoxin